MFTPEGKFITQWTNLQKPQGFYMGPDGFLYTTGKPVKRPDGKLLARWGGEDLEKPGDFFAPHGIWGDARGDIYIGELSVDQLRSDTPKGYPLVHKLVQAR